MSQKESAQKIGVNLKGKFGQLFCKHKNKEWFIENTINISGEQRRLICIDCGKEINNIFARYEGNGFK